jgi:DNA-binding CsgD family transcriptional regulator
VKDIAKTCGISANTAKEHVADVYHRLGVHSREALLAKLTGIAGQR